MRLFDKPIYSVRDWVAEKLRDLPTRQAAREARRARAAARRQIRERV